MIDPRLYPALTRVLSLAETKELKSQADKIAEKYMVHVSIAAEDAELWLDKLQSFKSGDGQKFMHDLVRAADKFPKVSIWLNAVPFDGNPMKPKELALWYEMFGFKVVEKTDWTDGYVMVRKPATA